MVRPRRDDRRPIARGDVRMRTQPLHAVALLTTTLLCTGMARAEDVPSADKAIEKSIKDLKTARDMTNNPADKERLSEAIAALEKAAAKKEPGKEDGKE